MNHDFLGTVVDYDGDSKIAHVQVRNVIQVGDRVEALMPGKPNEEYDVLWMRMRRMRIFERANKPMTLLQWNSV